MPVAKDQLVGIALPECGGARSSSEFGRAVLADAVRSHDSDLAQVIESSPTWHASYPAAFRSMTALSATAAETGFGIAADGLASTRALLRVAYGKSEASVAGAAWRDLGADLATESVHGSSSAQCVLEVPFSGSVLSGQALRDQLHRWRDDGIVEPGFAAAIERVIDNPDWLSMPGCQVVVIGAGAELGPYEPFTRWGATVLAVDLPGADRWGQLLQTARTGAGSVRYPLGPWGSGLDVSQHFPQLRRWILTNTSERSKVVFGTYARASGVAQVELAAAVDLVAEDLLSLENVTLAYLASPLDCYAVGAEVVAAARERWRERGRRAVIQDMLRIASRSALFRPNYAFEVVDANGNHWGLADALLPLQGANHALARRLQRWRAQTAAAEGRSVSYNIAPLSWTQSVRDHRVLAGALHGAGAFGVEVFEAETARVLMAAKLVSDVFAPEGPSANPETTFYRGAAHGGLWRQPFEPKSVLGLAAAAGYPRAVFG
ncbi:hypothetical protein FOS14_12205 [Skermania sp. ID1734]|uniref:hypothetical protein n=1 Tax=Skermania sp. ID1734 TaxID=2597516 RepID=UPI00117C7E5B|nr:hypothetical protein [Skermania sp. ID1734]TSD99529.1 hypothetical protein FOS14_12205 [Skermania sp. ID1734]